MGSPSSNSSRSKLFRFSTPLPSRTDFFFFLCRFLSPFLFLFLSSFLIRSPLLFFRFPFFEFLFLSSKVSHLLLQFFFLSLSLLMLPFDCLLHFRFLFLFPSFFLVLYFASKIRGVPMGRLKLSFPSREFVQSIICCGCETSRDTKLLLLLLLL